MEIMYIVGGGSSDGGDGKQWLTANKYNGRNKHGSEYDAKSIQDFSLLPSYHYYFLCTSFLITRCSRHYITFEVYETSTNIHSISFHSYVLYIVIHTPYNQYRFDIKLYRKG